MDLQDELTPETACMLQEAAMEEKRRRTLDRVGRSSDNYAPIDDLDSIEITPSRFFAVKKTKKRKLLISNPTRKTVYISWNYRCQNSKKKPVASFKTASLKISKNTMKRVEEDGCLHVYIHTDSTLSRMVTIPVVSAEETPLAEVVIKTETRYIFSPRRDY